MHTKEEAAMSSPMGAGGTLFEPQTRRAGRSGLAARGEARRLIRCVVRNQEFGVDLSCVRGIERTDRLQRSPSDQGPFGWLLGGENEIPVYLLASWLGLAGHADSVDRWGPPARTDGPILILEGQKGRWGLMVDSASGVVQLSSQEMCELPRRLGGAALSLFGGVLVGGDRILLCLSPQGLGPEGLRADGRLDITRRLAAATPAEESAPPARPGAGVAERPPLVMLFSAAPIPGVGRPILFCLSVSQVPEVLGLPPILPVPRAAGPILGLVAWQGRPVPVFDLLARLGLPPSTEGHRRLLIARGSRQADPIALAIASEVRIVSLPLDDRPCEHAPPIDSSLVRAIVDLDEATVVLPELDRL